MVDELQPLVVVDFDLLGFAYESADREINLRIDMQKHGSNLEQIAAVASIVIATAHDADALGKAVQNAGLLRFVDLPASAPPASLIASLRSQAQRRRILYICGDARAARGAVEAGLCYVPALSLAIAMLADQEILIAIIESEAGVTPLAKAIEGSAVAPIYWQAENGREMCVAYICGGTRGQLEALGLTIKEVGDRTFISSHMLYLQRLNQVCPDSPPAGDVHPFMSLANGMYRLVALPVSLSDNRLTQIARTYGLTALRLHRAVSRPMRPESLTTVPEPVLSILDHADVDLIHRHVTEESMRPVVQGLVSCGSRNVMHPGNAQAVEVIVERFRRLGLRPWRHYFASAAGILQNVIAEVNPSCDGGTIIIGAHLDSIVWPGADYDDALDPAPGADDDASGVAGVFAIAEACIQANRRLPLRRKIRLVLFNSEEIGIDGSGWYTADRENLHGVIAMFQLDMVGYTSRDDRRRFEVHSGFSTDADVERRSGALGRIIERALGDVRSDNLEIQLHPTNDNAEGRSDHSSFHLHGCAACLVSEDFDGGPGDDFGDRNPHYHRPDDRYVHFPYAVDITRVVASAVLAMSR